MVSKALFSSNKDEWETPKKLFNVLNEYCNFTLDPCADNNNHKCIKYYDIIDNGLSKKWDNEVVFVNPPYSNIKEWSRKCSEEKFAKIVLLIPSRTDTKYFHKYIYRNAKLIFIKGRLKFSNSKNSAPFPSLLAFYNFDIDTLFDIKCALVDNNYLYNI